MKNLFLLVFLTNLFFSCSELRKTVYRIENAQKIYLKKSEVSRKNKYVSKARLMTIKKMQKKWTELKFKVENDTLILIEDCDNICFGCSPFDFEVIKDNKVYTLQQNWKSNIGGKDQYEKIQIKDSNTGWLTQYKQSMFFQMREAIKKENWNENPEKYSNPCLGGATTFITVLYPNGEIKTITVNCFNTN